MYGRPSVAAPLEVVPRTSALQTFLQTQVSRGSRRRVKAFSTSANICVLRNDSIWNPTLTLPENNHPHLRRARDDFTASSVTVRTLIPRARKFFSKGTVLYNPVADASPMEYVE